MPTRTRTLSTLLGLAAASAVALTGCASNSEGGGPTGSVTGTVSKDDTAAKNVPAKIKSRGTLIAAINAPYAPNEFVQNGKVVGFDIDLMTAISKSLGLKVQFRQSAFEQIIPRVQGGTYDAGTSSFTDTVERQKSVDFVDYYNAGVLWASPKGKKVDPLNACGLRVSVQSTTYEQTDELPALSKKCKSAGKKPITVVPYDDQDEATNAVVLGKVDAMSADSPITLYAIKQSGGKLQQAGALREAAPYGWAVKKGSTLGQAFKGALESLIKDGTYLQICTKWGVQAGAIKTVKINGGTI
ncbi:amino acid ABC transporter substrate-binding protein, PAAT family [Jatrophihabitans endophyticus]|uniref:Amino acid ABC transporter substrate-binding protein, PAAT family n=1 Tax=Jatrophihabitans endophyticus TaxID=1206085 RepID=A0A1M5TC96_9ACTN|nr:ABC transporter substrate-binding protein [Jatrophihabitans endophyticus]SHH48306.1 amino acid ABC transporter substrate-binding protein, PAAT family [Jatrophihabitans endophyticus]